jgi:hypothetical protein
MGLLRRSKVNWSGEFNNNSWISVRYNRRNTGSSPDTLGFTCKAKDIILINSLYLIRKRDSIFIPLIYPLL